MNELKILAVDDEAGMRFGMEKTLSRYKIKLPEIEEGETSLIVEIAESAEEAYDKIKVFKPDIMILDFKLPGMTGIELIEKAKEENALPLTIMITAYASLDTAVSAIKSGAFDFLAKPFTPVELREKVTKAAKSLLLARQLKKLADEKKKVRFQFISILGHELKSPLNAIEGYIRIMSEKAIGSDIDKYQEMLSRCMVRTDQMKKLILDLLELTKIESGERRRNINKFRLIDLIRNSVDLMYEAAKARNISIEVFADDDIEFNGDREELEIAINNLVSNAVKYNRGDGRVTVFAEKSGEKLVLSVEDTGIGLQPDELKQLFGEFVRIKNDDTKGIPGSGLGLSTVKKIAQLYNGEAIAESEYGKGSKFTLRLIDAKQEELQTVDGHIQ